MASPSSNKSKGQGPRWQVKAGKSQSLSHSKRVAGMLTNQIRGRWGKKVRGSQVWWEPKPKSSLGGEGMFILLPPPPRLGVPQPVISPLPLPGDNSLTWAAVPGIGYCLSPFGRRGCCSRSSCLHSSPPKGIMVFV